MYWKYQKFEQINGMDLYEIVKLRINVFIVEQKCPYPELDDLDFKAIHICCKDETGLVAYARLLPEGVKYEEPSIGRVIVRQDRRGMGLAHILMEQCINQVDELWGVSKIRLQAQVHLEEFYGTHGFKAISSPYEEDGIPHVDMILQT